MRQTLLRFWLEHPWSLLTRGADELPWVGICWVWLMAGATYLLYHLVRRRRGVCRDPLTWIIWGLGLLAFSVQTHLKILPATMPVFGYGLMVMVGFLAALLFSRRRASAIGVDPELVTDAAFWLLIFGVVGGRLAYLVQYRNEVFPPGRSLGQWLFAAVNLAEGGLVLIGALAAGLVGFLIFCRRRKIPALDFADLLTPAIFIGIGFGRIGCLLNGCCFGDRCDLPWGITFPAGSLTFKILVEQGFVDPAAAATFPLHPTQIYSAIDGFVLAVVTGAYYWYRRHPGDVFALGCILYSITRILIEFLRADEMGQFGTGLTISQLYCVGILAAGLVLWAAGRMRAGGRGLKLAATGESP